MGAFGIFSYAGDSLPGANRSSTGGLYNEYSVPVAPNVSPVAAASESRDPSPTFAFEDFVATGRETLPWSEEAISFASVERGARKFVGILASSGIQGARKYSERCHQAAGTNLSWDILDYCASFDFAGAAMDRSFSAASGAHRDSYFVFQAENQSQYYAGRAAAAYARLRAIESAAANILVDAHRSSKLAERKATTSDSIESHESPAGNTPDLRSGGSTVDASFSPDTMAPLAQVMYRQVKPYWSAPQGLDAELLVTVLRFRLNADGSLAGTPEVIHQSGMNANNTAQVQPHAERAIRAVRLATPFDLPEELHDRWKLVTLRFDSR